MDVLLVLTVFLASFAAAFVIQIGALKIWLQVLDLLGKNR